MKTFRLLLTLTVCVPSYTLCVFAPAPTPVTAAPVASKTTLPTMYIQNSGSTPGTITQINLEVKDLVTQKIIPLSQTVNIALPAQTKNGPASVVEFNPTVSGAKNQLAFNGMTQITINGSVINLNPAYTGISAQTALHVKQSKGKWVVDTTPSTTGATGKLVKKATNVKKTKAMRGQKKTHKPRVQKKAKKA